MLQLSQIIVHFLSEIKVFIPQLNKLKHNNKTNKYHTKSVEEHVKPHPNFIGSIVYCYTFFIIKSFLCLTVCYQFQYFIFSLKKMSTWPPKLRKEVSSLIQTQAYQAKGSNSK